MFNVGNLCEDFKKLKPYDYEPLASSSDESSDESESNKNTDEFELDSCRVEGKSLGVYVEDAKQ